MNIVGRATLAFWAIASIIAPAYPALHEQLSGRRDQRSAQVTGRSSSTDSPSMPTGTRGSFRQGRSRRRRESRSGGGGPGGRLATIPPSSPVANDGRLVTPRTVRGVIERRIRAVDTPDTLVTGGADVRAAFGRARGGIAIMPGAWLAVFLPAVLIAVALGLERLERHLSGPPDLDPQRPAGSPADVPRSAPARGVRVVPVPSRLTLAVASCVVVAAGVTALLLGRPAPAPVPLPVFTAAPPAAVVPPPPVFDDIVVPTPVPAVAQQAARPVAVAHVVPPPSGTTGTTLRRMAGPRAVVSAGESASDKVRDRAGSSASSSGKSQAKRSPGGGSGTSSKKGNAKDKGKKPKPSHGNKGGGKG